LVEHTRGFHAGEFNRMAVLDSWAIGSWEIRAKIRRFRGMGTALALGQGRWREWVDSERILRLEPSGTKRRLKPGAAICGKNRIRPDKHLITTLPAETVEQVGRTGLDTTPLKLSWIEGTGFDPDVYLAQDRADAESEDAYE
jgi:hypothetical protein